MNMWSFSQNEWTEIYVVLKLLSEAKIYGADENLQKNSNIVYPIKTINYDKFAKNTEFLSGNEILIRKEEELRLPLEEIKHNSRLLFEKIKTAPGGSQTFQIPELEPFLKRIKVTKKIANTKDRIVLSHDSLAGEKPSLSFSVLSQLNRSASFFSSCLETNFIYELKDLKLSQDEIEGINSLDLAIERIRKIRKHGGNFEVIGTQDALFGLNMQLIDGDLPEIMGFMLLESCSSEKTLGLKSLLPIVEERNPCNFPSTIIHQAYKSKVKKFMIAVIQGMAPSKTWDDTYDVTRGHIVVRADGEVLYYHVYNQDQFAEYLIANTYFVSPSISECTYGRIYTDDNKLYLKLNMQIS
ncbi:MAG: HpaII family restriction endonuclease [Bacteroidales bacterium]|nr:HpaII family restriction endonuclease [Bacteroidales bacterium]